VRRLLLDINAVAVLFVVIGVTLVLANYQDGYPDVSSAYHGDWPPTWANYAEVKAWYCAPLRYNQEYHRAYCYAGWGKAVIYSNITFWAVDGGTVAHRDSWLVYDAQDKSQTYYDLATAATTRIEARYYDALNGNRWTDTAIATVVAGTGPE